MATNACFRVGHLSRQNVARTALTNKGLWANGRDSWSLKNRSEWQPRCLKFCFSHLPDDQECHSWGPASSYSHTPEQSCSALQDCYVSYAGYCKMKAQGALFWYLPLSSPPTNTFCLPSLFFFWRPEPTIFSASYFSKKNCADGCLSCLLQASFCPQQRTQRPQSSLMWTKEKWLALCLALPLLSCALFSSGS